MKRPGMKGILINLPEEDYQRMRETAAKAGKAMATWAKDLITANLDPPPKKIPKKSQKPID